MNDLELRNKIAELLPEYEFSVIDLNCQSIFGFKYNNLETIKTNDNSTVIKYNRIVFVSSEMYPGTDRNFRYATIETKSKLRKYRGRTWYDSVHDKRYISAKTDEELLEKIKIQFTCSEAEYHKLDE